MSAKLPSSKKLHVLTNSLNLTSDDATIFRAIAFGRRLALDGIPSTGRRSAYLLCVEAEELLQKLGLDPLPTEQEKHSPLFQLWSLRSELEVLRSHPTRTLDRSIQLSKKIATLQVA